MTYPKRYSKKLNHLTTFRLSDDLRQKAGECAEYLGISFSDYVRQSIIRNIHISKGIEEEVNRQTTLRATGKNP